MSAEHAAKIVDAICELARTQKDAWVKNDGPDGYDARRERVISLLSEVIAAPRQL